MTIADASLLRFRYGFFGRGGACAGRGVVGFHWSTIRASGSAELTTRGNWFGPFGIRWRWRQARRRNGRIDFLRASGPLLCVVTWPS